PFVLATVVARTPPISAHLGDMALVTAEGVLHGWVGGSCTRETVLSEARRALADGQPRSAVLDPDPDRREAPGVSVHRMTCHSGGNVEIHIQPVLPPPALLVFGVSPTARALARLAQAMGWAVHVVDPAADPSAFPGAASVSAAPGELRLGQSAPTLAVVATQGQWDEDALLAALAHRPDYVGVVASPRRFAEMRRTLAGRAEEADLGRIRSPAGLDLGARLPEEVALSILAEAVKLRHEAAARPGTEAPSPAAPAAEARDPVCGMTVRVEGAPHRAQHEGRDFFFCAAGCRERFLQDPRRYLDAAPR
ncbi:MAG TPA: XdhC family protein, partial [Vicinamibacteria bacterium]